MSALPASAPPGPIAGSVGAGLRWALMFGNFVIGCGVMSAAGTLNDIARSLQVSVALAGQLIAVAGLTIAIGAPCLAGWVSGFDRRRLLAFALVWYGIGHALSAVTTSYALLLPIRALTVLGAAVFTPQAAAAVGFMATLAERGRAITFVFLGWSVASVLGLPLSAWIGQSFGWQTAFGVIALLSFAAAAWVFVAMPNGVRPAALSLDAWRQVLTQPVLMAMVAVTAVYGAGQFTLFSYFAPYFQRQLGAGTGQITLLLMWFGAFGLIGNIVLTRVIDRVGADLAVNVAMALIAISLLVWPLGVGLTTMGAVLIPWGLGCFATNSGQQARLGIAAPTLAPALMALNTSAIYLGQAIGAASGGWLIEHEGFAPLPRFGFGWMLAAILLSLWVQRRKVVFR